MISQVSSRGGKWWVGLITRAWEYDMEQNKWNTEARLRPLHGLFMHSNKIENTIDKLSMKSQLPSSLHTILIQPWPLNGTNHLIMWCCFAKCSARVNRSTPTVSPPIIHLVTRGCIQGKACGHHFTSNKNSAIILFGMSATLQYHSTMCMMVCWLHSDNPVLT